MKKTVSEHLSELRYRILCSAISVFIGAIAGYLLNKEILFFLTLPLGKPLYYTSPTGGFDLVFMTSLLFGLFVAAPVINYQFLSFIMPTIPNTSASSMRKFLFASWLLLICGASVAYYLSLPAALSLLSEFGSSQVQALISTKDYFSFIFAYLGGFGLIFQLPILFLAIHKIKPLSPKSLLKKTPYVILISFIVAAILTPTPDPINQTIMALPTILLYLLTVIIIFIQPTFLYAKR